MSKYKVAPLKGSFMLASILGFFISVYLIKNLSYQWAWAIGFLCVIMFCASLISMTYGPPAQEFLVEEKKKSAAKRKAVKKKVAAKKK